MAAGAAGVAGGTGRATAAGTVVDLGKQGLKDGDDVSPYIDQYWTDGAEVHIPAGSYRYDGSGMNGKRGNCALIGSEDGVEFHRPDDGSQIRPTIQCTHGTMRVENITVRGASPSSANTDGSRWRFDALDPDSRIEVVNVNHPDGSVDRSDSNAFLSYDDHRGTLHFKNCYVANFGNSAFYTNLGYGSGRQNPVVVENCTIVNANGAIRGGNNGSKYVDCTFVWREEPRTWVNGASIARGIRWDYGGKDELVENCHFHFGSGIGASGSAMKFEDKPIGGTVRDVFIHNETGEAMFLDAGGMDGWTFENVHVTGPGNTGAGPLDGVQHEVAPDLRNEDAVWMPESQTVRPGGGSAGQGASESTGAAGANTSEGGQSAANDDDVTIATGGSGTISTRGRSG